MTELSNDRWNPRCKHMHSCLFALNPEHKGFSKARMSGKTSWKLDTRSQRVIDEDSSDEYDEEEDGEEKDVAASKEDGGREEDDGQCGVLKFSRTDLHSR